MQRLRRTSAARWLAARTRAFAPDTAVRDQLPTPAPLSLGERYLVARETYDTAEANIEWLVANDVHNWTFRYEDMLQYWYNSLIPASPGMIYDIGAHRGRHTTVFASLGRPVVAFEPTPHIREILLENTRHFTSITVRHEALCNRSGRGQFVVNLHAPEESGIEQRIYNDEANAEPTVIEVQYARLDELHDNQVPVSFVKIDTEGGELDILRGARDVLTSLRPVISVEYGFPGYSRYGHSTVDLVDLADDLGYAIFDIFGFPVHQQNYREAIDRFAWDYLLLPMDRPWLAAQMPALRWILATRIAQFV